MFSCHLLQALHSLDAEKKRAAAAAAAAAAEAQRQRDAEAAAVLKKVCGGHYFVICHLVHAL